MIMTILSQAAFSLTPGVVAIGAALAVIGAAFGISKIGATALESIARQPESTNDIRMTMIIAAALIEGAALFAIVICFFALN